MRDNGCSQHPPCHCEAILYFIILTILVSKYCCLHFTEVGTEAQEAQVTSSRLHCSGKAELGFTRSGWPRSLPWCFGPDSRPQQGERTFGNQHVPPLIWQWRELSSPGRHGDIPKAHCQGVASQPQRPGLRTPGPVLPLGSGRCVQKLGCWTSWGHRGPSCALDERVSDGALGHLTCFLTSSCTLGSLIATTPKHTLSTCCVLDDKGPLLW